MLLIVLMRLNYYAQFKNVSDCFGTGWRGPVPIDDDR